MNYQFIAPKIKTLNEVVDEYPNGANILLRATYPCFIGYEDLCQLEKELQELSIYAIQQIMPGMIYCGGSVPFREQLETVAFLKKKQISSRDRDAALFYSEKSHVTFSDKEHVSGYNVEKYISEDMPNIMDWERFKFLWDQRYEKIDDESFDDWLNEELCSEWSKVDIGGSYTYGEGLRSENIAALLKLDYPRRWIQEVIHSGCSNLFGDNLPFVVTECEWIRRKGLAVFGQHTRKELCRKVILDTNYS